MRSPFFALSLVVLAAALASVAPTSAHAQELTVTCLVELPGVAAATVEFGLSTEASDGIDALDEPLPPGAPGQVLRAYLTMLVPPVPELAAWRRDIRSFAARAQDRTALFAMTIECIEVGDTLTITTDFALDDAPPYSLRLMGPGGLDRPMAPGEVVEVVCTAPELMFFWELQYDEQVPAAPQTWGGVKARHL